MRNVEWFDFFVFVSLSFVFLRWLYGDYGVYDFFGLVLLNWVLYLI